MKHKSGDMARRRQAAYRKGRRDLADDILALLREGRLDAVQERLRAETKQVGGHTALHSPGQGGE
ncbi:hypothetical protein [Microvirga sp. VF16]|uniref:hypothetical protein n=1 Tax=Microvirga sp. VF16 TaxID=2807101 RepID=UPI00193DC0B2|nr:hypothetical protein [Microvirga sp. VF16]QRM27346.1 hypothetical protein JO965_13650 [Microvirga sp. VF16]